MQKNFSIYISILLGSFFIALAAAKDIKNSEKETDTPKKEEVTPQKGEKEDVKTPQKEEAIKVVDVDVSEESEHEEAETAVARVVSGDPVQVYGWREWVYIQSDQEQKKLLAKLDTGARTSSIHVEKKEMFERDGKKWIRFVVTDPTKEKSAKMRVEAPLVRIARIKNPGGESETRETVLLTFKIGERNVRAEFTLNNRENMLSPVLIGRRTIKELGWVDPGRVYLADKKVMR